MLDNNRKFNLEDAVLLEHASTVVSSLPLDIADFTQFNVTFGQQTIANLQTCIDAASTTKPDSVVKEELAQRTYLVNRNLDTCNEAYKTVLYFVRKVFKDDEGIKNQFGINGIEKAREDHGQMIVFMRSLTETVNQYQVDLIIGGMSEGFIASLPNLHQELLVANNNQAKFKEETARLTQDRVEKMNRLYDELLPISNAAQRIYADNPEQLTKYVLPDSSSEDLEQ